MTLDYETLQSHITWHREYRPAWDDAPDEYASVGVVPYGKSKRLGLFQLANIKGYIGVQHIDPSKPGWGIVEQAQARFFLSLFVDGRCLTLRTFPTMDAVLAALAAFVTSTDSARSTCAEGARAPS